VNSENRIQSHFRSFNNITTVIAKSTAVSALMCKFLISRFDCSHHVVNSTKACLLKIEGYKNPLTKTHPNYRSCPDEKHIFPIPGKCPKCIEDDTETEARRQEARQHSLLGGLQSLWRGNKNKPLPPLPGQQRDGSGSRPDISWPIPIAIAPRPTSLASDDTTGSDDKFFPERAAARSARKIPLVAAPSRRARSTVGPPKIPERRSSLPQVERYAPKDSRGLYIGTDPMPKPRVQTIHRKPVPTRASATNFSYGKRENRLNSPHVGKMQASSVESSPYTMYESSSSNHGSTSSGQEYDLFLSDTEPSSSTSSQQEAELFLPDPAEKITTHPSILLPARGRPILKKRNFAVDFAQVPKVHYDLTTYRTATDRAPPRIPSLEFDDYHITLELDHVDPLRSHPVEVVEEWPLKTTRPERPVPVMQRPPPEQCLQPLDERWSFAQRMARRNE
jgi:hypothetical protein